MRRWGLVLCAAILVLAVAGGCNKDTTTEPQGSAGSGTDVPSALVLARTFPPILANGVDEITVRATVVNSRGVGLDGVGVHFTTNHGTIDAFATTSGGVAEVTLTSEASTADLVAQVTASASNDSVAAKLAPGAEIFVSRLPLTAPMIDLALEQRAAAASKTESGTVTDMASVPMTGVTVALAADPDVIPADGLSRSVLTARVFETTRHVPIANEQVHFGATAGSIDGSSMTDLAGNATAALTGRTEGAASHVTAYYGATLTATATVTFSSLAMTIDAASPSLIADGNATTTVVARLSNAERNPIEGARIDFTASLGSVTGSATTDAQGRAVATLAAGDTTGTAHVTARFGTGPSASVDVAFLAVPTAATVLLSANPGVLAPDGMSEATLTATALDAAGEPVPDGTAVVFSIVSGGGHIIGPTRVTADGQAEAVYVVGTTAGVVTVQAASGTADATATIGVGSSNIALTAGSTTILADGLASTTITATVTDVLGRPAAAGAVVEFQTSRGQISNVTPTDASGVATARLRANRFETGLARVSAAAEQQHATIDVNFVSEDAAHIEALSVDHPSIGVLGASDHETATLFFEVQDRNGIPVDATHSVTLSFSAVTSGGDPDPTVYPLSASTDAEGHAATTLNAGTMSGTVEVRATSGNLISQPIRVVIHGDLPDPAHFSVFAHRVNIPGLVYANYQNEICAKVADQHGNPVPDSTAVWLSAAYGIVQAQGYTDDLGDACVNSISAAPFPLIPGGDGLVQVCAQTTGKTGDRIETCTNVMWSGHTIVEITSPVGGFDVPNGGSVTITFDVRDANDNPLTMGTSITVSTTGGTLGGDVANTLPDTQSQAYTHFSVTLSDGDVEMDLAQSVTVTVAVQSENGNRNASITGTIH